MYEQYTIREFMRPWRIKNYVNSFASNVEDNIEKARKKAGMIFLLTLIVIKQIHSFISNFGEKHVYLLYYLALNFLY